MYTFCTISYILITLLLTIGIIILLFHIGITLIYLFKYKSILTAMIKTVDFEQKIFDKIG